MQITHRHFVAVPFVALAMLLIAGFDTALQARTTLDQPPSVGSGTTLRGVAIAPLDEEGAAYADDNGIAVVQSGAYVLSTDHYGRAQAGDVSAHWFGGAIGVMRDTTWTSIVALDTPVLVTQGGRDVTVAPLMQVRISAQSGMLLPTVGVPGVWINEAMSRVRHLPADIDEDTLAAHDDMNVVQSKEDAWEYLTQQPLADLSKDQATLSLMAARVLLPGTSLSELLALRLSAERQYPATRTFLLSSLTSGVVPKGWHDILLGFARDSVSAASETHATAWLTLARRAAAADPAACDDAQAVQSLANSLEEKGYPQSAKAWRDAQDAFRYTCDALLAAVPVVEASASESGAVIMQESVVYDAAHTEAAAKRDVIASGLLLTVDASFVASPPDHRFVRVSGIVTPSGHTLSFSYDTVEHIAGSIERDGVRLANPVTLDLLVR